MTLPATERSFSLSPQKSADSLVVFCRGRLTADASDYFKHEIKALLPTTEKLILDFEAVTHMDSSGLGAVVSVWATSRSAECQLQICNLSRPVQRLLGVTHVLQAFEACGAHLTRLP